MALVADAGLLRGHALHQPEQHQLVAMSRQDGAAVDVLRRRQAGEGRSQEAERIRPGTLLRAHQDGGQRIRRQRQHVPGALHLECHARARDLNPARLQHSAVLVGQDRDQDLLAQALFLRLPVHVEERRILARRSILQHVPPIAVLAAQRHVVGHNVQHLAQPQLAQPGAEMVVPFFPAQLRVHPLVVHDVVAVQTARGGL
jgi:hypothetical protein